MKYILIIAITYILIAFQSIDKEKIGDKITSIDKYAAQIDSNLEGYKRNHFKCRDFFGFDEYFKDSVSILKIHNYQSCFKVDYYYDNNRLVLVTIDGSFKINTKACGCDSINVRDYKVRIYYNKKKIIKEIESGSQPCYKIRSIECYKGVAIDFDKKAKIFLKRYGHIKHKAKSPIWF